MTEEKLIERLRAGRRDVLHQAIRRYTAYVSAIIYRTLGGLGTQEDLEEITADVFLALWTQAKDLEPSKGIRSYLAAIARNKAIDHLRTAPKAMPLSEDAPDRSDGPEEMTLHKEEAELLWGAINAMEEPDRTLFLRYYYDDEPLGAVARDLGLNPSTAKTRLFRGRKRLKQILMEGGDGVGEAST